MIPEEKFVKWKRLSLRLQNNIHLWVVPLVKKLVQIQEFFFSETTKCFPPSYLYYNCGRKFSRFKRYFLSWQSNFLCWFIPLLKNFVNLLEAFSATRIWFLSVIWMITKKYLCRFKRSFSAATKFFLPLVLIQKNLWLSFSDLYCVWKYLWR